VLPGSRYAKAVMVAVTVVIILGLVASMVAAPVTS
jgi:hypothetical protein